MLGNRKNGEKSFFFSFFFLRVLSHNHLTNPLKDLHYYSSMLVV
jgi:hypothetical protein